MIRLVLAEDHAVVAEGFAAMLSFEGDLEVVDIAACGDSLLAAVETHRPDVALVDVSLAGTDGLTAVAEIRARGLPVKAIVLSMHTDSATVSRAIAAGVVGYLPKDISREELVEAVRTAAGGKAILHPDVTGPLLDSLNLSTRNVSRAGGPETPRLSRREQQVLEGLAAGRSTAEIAESLQLGAETVKSHLARLYCKLGVKDKLQAVVTAMRQGLVR